MTVYTPTTNGKKPEAWNIFLGHSNEVLDFLFFPRNVK